jgi:hypothetical protein
MATQSALPDLAQLPAQPHVRHGRGRHVRCRNRDIPASLRPDRSWPRPQKGHPLRGHSKSNANLARAPNNRGVSLKHGAALSAAGPGRIIWSGLPRSRPGHGNQGGRHCSAWQNPYVERVIGSIRRECLDQVIIFDERHLRGVLSSYFCYYHKTRTLRWPRLSEQIFRVDKWNLCRG